MPSVNKVILVGNLTRDPVTRELPNQSNVAEFGLAMNRKFKGPDGEDREEVCFVDCAAFGRQAEVIQKYCQKGKSLYIEGRLRFDSWDDKNGGGKRSKLSVVVENFQFIGGKEGGEQGGGGGGDGFDRVGGGRSMPPGNEHRGRANAGHPPRKPNPPPTQPFGDNLEFKEADIPFDRAPDRRRAGANDPMRR